MKTLIIFYTTCIIILYATFAYIGYRNKHIGDLKNGILPEVVISVKKLKTDEARMVANHLDKAMRWIRHKNNKRASQQVYGAMMVLAMREVTAGNYDRKTLELTLGKLKECCVDLWEGKKVSEAEAAKLFESTELMIAEDYMLRSEENIVKNKYVSSVSDAGNAEECIVFAQRFTGKNDIDDLTRNRKMYNECNSFLRQVVNESGTSYFKRTLKKIDHKLEGPSV